MHTFRVNYNCKRLVPLLKATFSSTFPKFGAVEPTLSDLCPAVISLPCILIHSHVLYRWAGLPVRLPVLAVCAGSNLESVRGLNTDPPSVIVDTSMWGCARYHRHCSCFGRRRSCAADTSLLWVKPHVWRSVCVCLLLRYFHNHIFFSTSTHRGILHDAPRRLSHAELDTVQMWTNTGPAAQIYMHIHPPRDPLRATLSPHCQSFEKITSINPSIHPSIHPAIQAAAAYKQ